MTPAARPSAAAAAPRESTGAGELARALLIHCGDAQLAPAVYVHADATLEECVRGMRARHVSCLLVGAEDDPAIVTRTDLLNALALEGYEAARAVAPLARRPLVAVSAQTPLFEALLQMTRGRIERVVVRGAGGILGTLGLTELFGHLSNHSHLIALQLERAEDIAGIAAATRGLPALLASLHAQGVRAVHLMELASALNARALARACELLWPPGARARACLLVLGSEGRGEQILKTDQDNALILADDLDWPAEQADCARLSAALAALGWPPCPGRVMVDNPHWRLRASAWQARVRGWAQAWDPAAMLELAILLDARVVAGDAALHTPLQRQLLALGGNAGLMRAFAAPVQAFATPLTLFGRLRSEAAGIDLKKGAIFPLVHGLRTLALRAGIGETHSLRRADALVASGELHASDAHDVQQALELFWRLRLGEQLRHSAAGAIPGNHVDPQALRRLDRAQLRDALRVVDRFKQLLASRFP